MARVTGCSKRIFLSYGHDKYTVLAERLKNDLKKHHHHVWFDLERLKAGVDWEAYISDGLDWTAEFGKSGLFLLLLTPHSVRRPDGYCLNELARAIDRGLTIIPVLVAQVESPLSIARIQRLDMCDCWPLNGREERYRSKFARLLEAIDYERLDFDGAEARLSKWLPPISFANDVQKHLRRFVGRKWVFKQLNDWFSDPSASRVFWITGSPGTGKSAIASWLCTHRAEIGAMHFCVYSHTQKSEPRQAVLSIAYQLATQLPDYHDRVKVLPLDDIVQESQARTLFDRLITQPLTNCPSPGRNIAILIDALDEATRNGTNELAALLGSELERLPEWVRCVLTSRPELEVTIPLQALTPFVLDTSSSKNEIDLRAFLKKELPLFAEEAELSAAIDVIVQKSEGLFLYAEYVRKEIELGRLSLAKVLEFPQGFGGILDQYFKRQFPDSERFAQDHRPVLEVIAASKEPLELEYLKALFGWSEYDSTLEQLGSLFPVWGKRVEPFHKSVLDWLVDRRKSGAYFTSIVEGHRRLSEHGWHQYKAGARTMHPYAVQHLATHLSAVGERSHDLSTLVLDFDWIHAKLLVNGTDQLCADLDLARRDKDVRLVRDAIGLSVQPLKRNGNELPAQFLGRLTPTSTAIRSLLDRAKHCRGFSWLRPLQANLTCAGGPLRCALKGHFGTILGLGISEKPERVVSSSGDGNVKIWDLESGEELHNIKIPAQVTDIAVSSRGKVVVATDVGTLGVLDIQSGALCRIFSGHRHIVNLVEVVLDGTMALSSAWDGTLVMWDIDGDKETWLQGSNEETLDPESESENVCAMTVSEDGTLAVTGHANGKVKLWHLPSEELRFVATQNEPVGALGISSAANRIVATSYSELNFFELESGRLVKSQKMQEVNKQELAVVANEETMLVPLENGTIEVWDLRLGQRFASLQGHSDRVSCIAVTKDGKKALSGSWDSTVRVWDLESQIEVQRLSGHSGDVWRVVVSQDGLTAVSGGNDATVIIWSLDKPNDGPQTMVGHSGAIRCITVSVKGRYAATGSYDGSIKIWDLSTFKELQTLKGHRDVVSTLVFTSDGNRIVSGSFDSTIRVWKWKSGATLQNLKTESRVMILNSMGERIVSLLEGGKLEIWDFDTGDKIQQETPFWGGIGLNHKQVSISGDGRTVVGGHNSVEVVSVRTGKTEFVLEDDDLEEITAVTISPDNRFAAIASGVTSEGHIRIWDITRGECVRSIVGPASTVTDLAFFPDKERLVFASKYGWLGVWDIATNDVVTTYSTDWSVYACRTVSNQLVVAGDSSGRVHFLEFMRKQQLGSPPTGHPRR